MIRNPYRALISFWNWEKTGNNTGLANTGSFCSTEFREFVFNAVSRWCELIEDWVTWGKNLKVVFFEELSRNPVEETREILNHLEIGVDSSRLVCLSRHLEGRYHRRRVRLANPFSPEQRAVTSWAVERVGRLLQERLNINIPDYQLEQGEEDPPVLCH